VMCYHKWFGLDILWKHRDMLLRTQLYSIKTIRAQCWWKIMVVHPVGNELSTSTFCTFLSRTELQTTSLALYTAYRKKCSLTFSQSHCRGHHSESSDIGSWMLTLMSILTRITGVCWA
jgi:hypothetical protein